MKSTLNDLRGEGRGWILLMVAAGWFFSVGVRFMFPALLPFIRQTYDISLDTAGILLSLLWLAYAVGQFPGGVIGDRIGEGRVLAISSVLSAFTLTILVLSADMAYLVLGITVFGAATALYGPTRFTILTDIFPDRSGTTVGLVQSVGQIGNAGLPVIGGIISGVLTWQYSLAGAIPFFVLISIGTYILVPARTSGDHHIADDLSVDALRRIFAGLKRRQIGVLLVIQVIVVFVFQAFTSFYPTYLIEAKGLSTQLATLLYGLFFAVAIVVQPVSGALVDRFEPRNTIIGFVLVTAVMLGVITVVDGLVPIILTTVLLSSILGIGPVTLTTLTKAIPQDMKGSGLGLLRTSYFLVASTGPLALGVVAARSSFEIGILGLGVMMACVLPFCLFLRPRVTTSDTRASTTE